MLQINDQASDGSDLIIPEEVSDVLDRGMTDKATRLDTSRMLEH